MRISIVAPFHGTVRGGVERHAEDLQAALRARGHSVDLGTSTAQARTAGADWVLFEGIDRRTLWRWRNRSPGSRPRVGVFTHGTFLPVVRLDALRARGWTSTAGDVARRLFDRTWMAGCLEAADRIFLLSRSEERDVAGLFPALRPRLEVVPMVLHARDRIAGERPADPPPYVAAVSRVDRRKNFPLIVEALAGTDIAFRLAGHDHGDVDRIRRRARTVGYGGFEYVGPVEDPAARSLLRGAIATVLPSYFEGVPYMVYQSLAQGTPSLCTDLCYLDPIPGIELSEPRAATWGRILTAWERGGRPSTALPPGPGEWDPLFRTLERTDT